MWGCEGAALESYVKWFQQKNPELANEKGYPYTSGSTGTPTKDTHSDDTCQQYDPYFQGSTYSELIIYFLLLDKGCLSLEGTGPEMPMRTP